jgi:hypothetical protein
VASFDYFADLDSVEMEALPAVAFVPFWQGAYCLVLRPEEVELRVLLQLLLLAKEEVVVVVVGPSALGQCFVCSLSLFTLSLVR